MDFIVRYRTASGEEKYEDMASLERAAGLVERLRNDAGVSDADIFKHVPIEFKTYYKVVVDGEPTELAASADALSADAPSDAPSDAPTLSAVPSGSDDAPAVSGSLPSGAMPLTPPTTPPVAAGEDTPADQPAAESGRKSLFAR